MCVTFLDVRGVLVLRSVISIIFVRGLRFDVIFALSANSKISTPSCAFAILVKAVELLPIVV
jgi:hypothetical protein